jgi:hypothetical protein
MKSRVELKVMDDLYKEIFSRNIGFFTESEQEKLQGYTITIMDIDRVDNKMKAKRDVN